MNNTEIDSLSIADLESRYRVNRSNLYKRINVLKEKGYSMEFESRDRKSYANADQIALLDRLHSHIELGRSMNSFSLSSDSEVSSSLARHPELSHKTRDTNGNESAIVKTSSQLIALTPEQLIELAAAIVPIPPAPPRDPFENLQQIEKAYRHEWRLSSSQLAPLLDRQTMPNKAFKMFGYRFTPEGRNGREKAWKIEKLQLLSNDDL